MENLKLVVQLIIALGIFNVWLINFSKPSKYRGGNAGNMSEEFETYGFNSWFMKLVGFLKLSMAVLLIAGIWYSNLVEYAAFVIGTLMVGAILAHTKINDPFIKSSNCISSKLKLTMMIIYKTFLAQLKLLRWLELAQIKQNLVMVYSVF